MGYFAKFKCINCDEEHQLNEVIYKCNSCGSLLEVVHDMEALKKHDASYWKELFYKRLRTTDYPYGSGIWSKKEWVLPNIDNENVVSLFEGNSNLMWAKRFGEEIGVKDLWIKQCGVTHTGSFKDLGMTVLVSMVNQMIKEGQNIKAVACASTGDTSAALAAYAAYAGIPCAVFLPKGKISIAQLVQPISNGAIVCALDTDFDGCMEIVQQVTEDKTIYLANSMNSLRIEGQKTVGIEICEQFGWEVPDHIIIPGGNLGNVSALGNGLLMAKELGLIDRLPNIILAQAENANPLYLSYKTGFEEFSAVSAKKTLASAIQIGNPVSKDKAIKTLKKFGGIVEQASEDELANASARADLTGLFNCPHTGVALAVLLKLVDNKTIKPKDRVVVISTAHGLKFANQKVDYHEGKIEGVSNKYSNKPIEVEADYDKVYSKLMDAINKR
jgi:threonine synthase